MTTILDKLDRVAHTKCMWMHEGDDEEVFTKIVELTNIMQAKGDKSKLFKIYATDRMVAMLKPKLSPCEGTEAAGEMNFGDVRWLVFQDDTNGVREKAAIKGETQIGVMTMQIPPPSPPKHRLSGFKEEPICKTQPESITL